MFFVQRLVLGMCLGKPALQFNPKSFPEALFRDDFSLSALDARISQKSLDGARVHFINTMMAH